MRHMPDQTMLLTTAGASAASSSGASSDGAAGIVPGHAWELASTAPQSWPPCPPCGLNFGLGEIGTQWTINAYLVVSASCIVLGGKAADLFGARLVSMAGLALFGVASCVIAVANSETALLAGRALQGFSAAFAEPSTLAVVGTSAAPQRRAASIGAWGGFLMLGFSIGPLFGGLLTHTAGWRVIFWLNIPLMCLGNRWPRGRAFGPAPRDGTAQSEPPTGSGLSCSPLPWFRWS